MQISVSDILKFEPLKSKSHVVAGHKGLSRIITSIGYLDSPLAPDYVKSGSLVFTSAYTYVDNEPALVDLIKQLARSHIACLGISFIFFEELPDSVVKTADQLNLPIIYIPPNLNWQEVNLLLDYNMFNRTKKICKNKNEVLKEINRVVFESGFTGATEILSEWTGLPSLVLFDKQFYTKDNEIVAQIPIDPKSWILKTEKNDILESNYYYYESPDGKVKWLAQPTERSNSNDEYVILVKKEREFLKDDFELLQFMTWACTNEINRINTLNFAISKKRQIFIKNIMENKYTLTDAKNAANECNFELPETGLLVLFKYSFNTDLPEINMIENIRLQITKIFGSTSIVCAYEENLIVAFISLDKKNLIPIAFENARKSGAVNLEAGISRPRSCQTLPIALREAKNAIEVGRCLDIDLPIYYIDQLGFYQLIQLQDPETQNVVNAYYINYLMPIFSNFNPDTAKEMMETLHCYVESCYKYNIAAEKLHIHRHTLRYRINLIQKVCNLNFDDQQDRFNMEIALKLLPLRK